MSENVCEEKVEQICTPARCDYNVIDDEYDDYDDYDVIDDDYDDYNVIDDDYDDYNVIDDDYDDNDARTGLSRSAHRRDAIIT